VQAWGGEVVGVGVSLGAGVVWVGCGCGRGFGCRVGVVSMLCRCCLELMLGLLHCLAGLWGGCGGSWCTPRSLLDGVGCRCRRGVQVSGWVW
jgi:hypothetical protein